MTTVIRGQWPAVSKANFAKVVRRWRDALFCLPLAMVGCGSGKTEVVVGSKAFTESVILGEMARLLAMDSGLTATHREQLAGSGYVWEALNSGQVDIYPEYTGTIAKEILHEENLQSMDEIQESLSRRGLAMTKPLGFSNTYIIGMQQGVADKLGIRKISDLRAHPELKLRFSNEFTEREDGWPALQRHYRLPQQHVQGLDHDVAYSALANGTIDVTDFYSTDAKLTQNDFISLDDDEGFFPDYSAVFLYRKDLEQAAPEYLESLRRLEGSLSAETMMSLNAKSDIDRVSETTVASDYLKDAFGVDSNVPETRWYEVLWRNARDHVLLVGASLAAGIAVAVPLGVLCAKIPNVGQVVLTVVGLVQTIPSIVLLVLVLPLPLVGGIGNRPAIFALFIYSLLPIVRSTHTGLTDIPRSILESAEALGLSSWSRLRRIELPLAARSILSGIKTAAVINVGTATLGGLIGAGGFGQPIFQGLRRTDWSYVILQGALPAAALSLLVLALFEVIERYSVPLGLRLKPVEP